MKKSFLMVIIAVFLFLFFVSCEKKNSISDDESFKDEDLIADDSDGSLNDDTEETDDKSVGTDEDEDMVDEDLDSKDDDLLTDEDSAEPEIFFVKFSAGGEHSCAVDSEGKIYCWGNNSYGDLGNGKEIESAVPVRVGDTGVLAGVKAASLSSGGLHNCAASDEGKVYCWGDNSFGQLGKDKLHTIDFSSIPVEVDMTGVLKDKIIVSVFADEYNTLAIDEAGSLYSWGRNTSGQLGCGTTSDIELPVEVDITGVLNGKKIISADAGSEHSCAVDDAGMVYCWGRNDKGQLGDGSTTDSAVPVEVDMSGEMNGKEIKEVSAGESYTCVIDTEGNVYCWGESVDSEEHLPVKIDMGGVLASSIDVNQANACVLSTLNKIYCWGKNFRGQLGDGTENDSLTPVEVNMSGVMKDKTIISIGAGNNFSCAMDDAGEIYCWGANTWGQCGNGIHDVLFDKGSSVKVVKKSELNGKKAVLIGTGLRNTEVVDTQGNIYAWGDFKLIPFALDNNGISKGISSMSSGDYHTCVIDEENSVYCWGSDNSFGQLGNNTTKTDGKPVKVDTNGVLKDKKIILLSSGGFHSCAVDNKSKIYCWGNNKYGQLGNGETSDSLIPVEVDMTGVLKGKTIKSIQSGRVHTCVLDSDGFVYCWGNNSKEQLGDNTAKDSAVPVKVYTAVALKDKNIVLLSAGGNHTCAVDDKSLVYCWGENSLGQLGIGYETAHYSPAPVDVSGVLKSKKITAISNGDNTTCAIDEDGIAYCWGSTLGNELDKSSVPEYVDMETALKGRKFVSISVGSAHVCSIDDTGEVYCWGDSMYGQTGAAIISYAKKPVKVFYSVNK